MLSAFKLKTFDLEPVFTSWTDGPIFHGDPKKDKLTVDKWLEAIKAGCVERDIPNVYWHKVGQHFMDKKAKARLDELKLIMGKVHGGKYRWTWNKFKVAMMNMGWEIDTAATETLTLRKSQGNWWVRRKKEDPEEVVVVTPPPASKTDRPSIIKAKTTDTVPGSPSATTQSKFWPTLRNAVVKSGTSTPSDSALQRPGLPVKSVTNDASFWGNIGIKPKTSTESIVAPAAETEVVRTPNPSEMTTITHAPIWLINASSALEFLSSEHPKAMSALSAILITVGTIPAIPIVASGGAGIVLASGAAQAIGALAVGVGSWLKAQQDGQVTVQDGDQKRLK